MGLYTQFVMTYGLKAETPAPVVAVHEFLLADGPLPDPLDDHPLFGCERWETIGRGAGEHPAPSRTFYRVDRRFGGGWEAGFACSFKDYDDEIRHWLDYIAPWADMSGQVIGWYGNNECDFASVIWARPAPGGGLAVVYVDGPPDVDNLPWL